MFGFYVHGGVSKLGLGFGPSVTVQVWCHIYASCCNHCKSHVMQLDSLRPWQCSSEPEPSIINSGGLHLVVLHVGFSLAEMYGWGDDHAPIHIYIYICTIYSIMS